ncbi:hypothetical protein AX761_24060 [Rhizobium sp. 58]|nr:hypothetical protein AX761_24060 [Rhizobium sp. 58]
MGRWSVRTDREATDTRVFQQQSKRVGQQFGLRDTRLTAEHHKPVMLGCLKIFDDDMGGMPLFLDLHGGIGEIAAIGLVFQTLGIQPYAAPRL